MIEEPAAAHFKWRKEKRNLKWAIIIQLATRLGVSVNNTRTTPYAARCVASTAHAKIRLPRISNV